MWSGASVAQMTPVQEDPTPNPEGFFGISHLPSTDIKRFGFGLIHFILNVSLFAPKLLTITKNV